MSTENCAPTADGLKRKRAADAQLEPNELESKLFAFLLRVVNENNRSTILRVAGGWVRDKLLHRSQDDVDIDIALDDMSGLEFAELVQGSLAKSDNTEASVAVIHRNPDKSKHLETARVKIFGHWIDLVNLRTEHYTEESRVPEIAVGTAEEDALRRDLTINALFYNVNERIIEDFTGRGLADLEAGVIATPLPPLHTFLDDPLRSLRSIRFASKLGFRVKPEVIEACKDREVRNALESKVSRERVGVEVDKMMNSSAPHLAIKLLLDTKMFLPVFLPASLSSREELRVDLEEIPTQCCKRALRFCEVAASNSSMLSREERRLGLYAALLSAFAGMTILSPQSKSNRPISVAAQVLRYSLKLRGRDADDVDTIHRCCLALLDPSFRPKDQLALGLLLRDVKELFAVSTAVAEVINPEFDSKDLRSTVHNMQLESVHNMKPLLPGKRVMQLLPRLPRGPVIGEVLQAQIEWQIMNIQATTEECERWLLSSYEQYT